MNRRKFNQKLGTGAVFTIGWSFLGSCNGKKGRRDTRAAAVSQGFDPDVDLELTAEEQIISILPGQKTKVWTFESPYLRSEEHTSELQSRGHLVCRLLLEKKKKKIKELIHRY